MAPAAGLLGLVDMVMVVMMRDGGTVHWSLEELRKVRVKVARVDKCGGCGTCKRGFGAKFHT